MVGMDQVQTEGTVKVLCPGALKCSAEWLPTIQPGSEAAISECVCGRGQGRYLGRVMVSCWTNPAAKPPCILTLCASCSELADGARCWKFLPFGKEDYHSTHFYKALYCMNRTGTLECVP